MSPRRAKAVHGRVGDDPATALRQHLIDTAERLLSERPVSAITTRDIARTAGVSAGVLYNYFADKDDLLVTALVRRTGRLVAQVQSDLPEPGTGTVEANLLAYAQASLGMLVEGLPIITGLLNQPALLHRYLEQIHTEPIAPQHIRGRIVGYLLAEQRLGRIPAGDPEAVATLLHGATAMLALRNVMPGVPPGSAGAALPDLVKTLIHGVGDEEHRPGDQTGDRTA